MTIGMRIMMMIIEDWLPWNTIQNMTILTSGMDWNGISYFQTSPAKRRCGGWLKICHPCHPCHPCHVVNPIIIDHHRPILPWPIFDPMLGPFLDSVTPQWSRKSGTPTPLRCRSPERNRTTTLVSHGGQGRQLHCTGHSPAANGISRIYIWI